MVTYIIHFSLTHPSFRLPELTSIAELHGFGDTMKITLADDLPGYTARTRSGEEPKALGPFVVVELENEAQAKILAERCVLIKWVRVVFGSGQLTATTS